MLNTGSLMKGSKAWAAACGCQEAESSLGQTVWHRTAADAHRRGVTAADQSDAVAVDDSPA